MENFNPWFFLGKKERNIHTFNKWLSNMPLVLSFANLNPCVDLNANVFRERDTNVIRSLQDFTAIPRKDFMKNFKFSTTHEEDLKLCNVSCRIWTVAILSRKLCVEIVLKSSNSLSQPGHYHLAIHRTGCKVLEKSFVILMRSWPDPIFKK